ncbi:serine hydrolase [Aerolutibacter ruishenii]|uniref:CubicO group peptidase (Beta-lactamase class C family) n=1 Tax=Aerolutibacter ruishenii TaxID=686800 RepID=A0A562LWX4_9GAMM|nr:serine hydrolase [Lysobacter ruishenii]TWI12053.1 CubicO group peptidase (beta-lactamase class C family) [Lysobacter ruishenii]
MRTHRLAALLAIALWGAVAAPAWADRPALPATTTAATVSAQGQPAAANTTALPEQLRDFDAYVERVRQQFNVPGIAVAIIKDGRIVLERGYGVREMGKAAKVDEHTMFAIASNTKAFTAASLSILADEGKLSLDDRVIDHLPWFRMADPYVTHEMRVRDLLAHRSGLGLGAGDLLYWPGTDYTTEEVARRLKDVPLTGSFRGQYAYDNILYGVAQLVVEKASGQSYADFLQARVFTPLGMDETRYNSDHLKPGDNVATGHAKADFKDLEPVAPMTWHNVSGAGGLYASVHDLTKWMRVQLDGGVISGEGDDAKRLFSAKRQKAMWSVITPMNIPEPSVPELAAAKPNFLGYGEGWQLSDYRGRKLVWHTGGWPGMVSRLTLVPEHKLGVVVLTSAEVGAAFNAVTMRALDAFVDAPRTDWVAAYAAAVAKAEAKADESWQRHVEARDARSKPSLPLARYAGTYRDAWYGDVVIAQEGGKLVMRFGRTKSLVGTLSHWQHDTFIVRWDERWLNADAFVTFTLDADGNIAEARIKAISPQTDFSFDFHDLKLVPVKAETGKGETEKKS